jgi:hypothetical protein
LEAADDRYFSEASMTGLHPPRSNESAVTGELEPVGFFTEGHRLGFPGIGGRGAGDRHAVPLDA